MPGRGERGCGCEARPAPGLCPAAGAAVRAARPGPSPERGAGRAGPAGRTRPGEAAQLPPRSSAAAEPPACHGHRPLLETDPRACVCLQEINGL